MSETRDQAATRRRWITLAEVVAVAGLLIGALGLWMSWSDRRAGDADRAAATASETRERLRFELRGEVAQGGGSITLLRDDRHALGDVRVTFPQAIGTSPHDAVGHAIEAEWFAASLLKLTDGGADDRVGRLPVLVSYTYTADDADVTRTAIYDVVWKTHGRAFRGRALDLTDFRLRDRRGTPVRLEAAWKREKP